MNGKNRNKEQIFEKEEQLLHEAQKIIAQNAQNMEKEQVLVEFKKMLDNYGMLLGEARLLTSVSDRLQSKLNKANENVSKKNEELRANVESLTKMQIQRQATNVVLLFTVFLFIISEGMIDANLQDISSDWFNPWFFIFMIKVFFAVLILPAQKLLEKMLLKGLKNQNVSPQKDE